MSLPDKHSLELPLQSSCRLVGTRISASYKKISGLG